MRTDLPTDLLSPPLSQWLRLYLPIAALICAAIYGYGRLEATRELDALKAGEQTVLQLATERFALRLANSVHDLRVMANAPSVRIYVEDPTPALREIVERMMGAFIAEKWEYEQFHLLDARGHEVLRVRRSAAGPEPVPAARLADQHGRDYFSGALALPVGQVHVSRLELDEDNGVVERPPRPVLRLSMRLSAGEGHPDFVLVADLRGAVLLKDIRDALATSAGAGWLLDEDGYWLMHPDPAMEWGRQLDPSKRLQQHHPQLAAAIARGDGDSFADGEPYLYRHVEPLASLVRTGTVKRSPGFELVTGIDAGRLPPVLPARLLWALAVLLLIGAAASALVVSGRRHAARAERHARSLIERSAAENEERVWVRERVYQFGLKVYATHDPVEFGNTVLVELGKALRLVAARLYALRDQHAELIASFGVSDRHDTRSFGPGEGLVGEAARTRQERRMTPPPRGYLDLSTGLAAAPAADLRILPLWVHGRTVGVVELAFVEVLDARQEELLRQSLPLLALNLDGFLLDARRAA